MYRHVLFDIDGTMIDSEPYYVECLNEVCRRFLGHSPAAEAVRRCFAMNSHDALHALGVGTHALSEAVALYDALCFQPDKVPVCRGSRRCCPRCAGMARVWRSTARALPMSLSRIRR